MTVVNRATLAGVFGGEFANVFDAVMGEQIGASAKTIRGLGKRTIDLREAILETFEQCEKPVTVRQMFYQLTVRGAIPKTEAGGYRPVQRQLVLMRREGLIPYDWIADNTRWMRKPTTYRGLHDFFARSARYYRQDLWIDSDVYVEVWCEKDALAGVIAPITSEYDVPLIVRAGSLPNHSFTRPPRISAMRIGPRTSTTLATSTRAGGRPAAISSPALNPLT